MILFLSPHTDDIEFGCGGTLARFLEQGEKVMVIAFSACQESIPKTIAKDTLEKAFKDVLKVD